MSGPPEVPGWRLETCLWRGPAGSTWLAEGPPGRVILQVAGSLACRERLRRVAVFLRRIGHPVFPAPVDQGPDWLAFRADTLTSLDAWSTVATLAQRVDLVVRLARGVAALHAHGRVHGRLVPEAVLVDRLGRPVVLDPGRAFGEEAGPGPGCWSAPGRPGFTAPEELAGGAPSPAGDVYALGALLYHLLVGWPPFGEAGGLRALSRPFTGLPEPPSATRPSIPALLDDLVLRALARNPTRRPSPAALAPALAATLGTPPAAPVVGMRAERERLRSLVVAVSEGGAAAVILHGPPGTGRRTLQREAARHARRQGFRVLVDPPAEPEPLLAQVRDPGPAVVLWSEAGPGERDAAARILQADPPALLLLRASARLPDLEALGAIPMRPPPLDVPATAALLEAAGLSAATAAEVHEVTAGAPERLVEHLFGGRPHPPSLSPRQRRLLRLVARGHTRREELATRLGLTPGELEEVARPLLAWELLREGGSEGSWVPGGGRRWERSARPRWTPGEDHG